jgi:hypothetical protein
VGDLLRIGAAQIREGQVREEDFLPEAAEPRVDRQARVDVEPAAGTGDEDPLAAFERGRET